jgi:MFS superfamily sulfate permease-like transporter/CRP-like cAMP-binding protein
VGGYLAFIGWFCIQAGTSLAISAPLDSLADAWELLGDGHEILLAVPALLAGLVLVVVARNVTHGAALPTTVVVIPLLFYLVLFVSGCSMDRARDFGWVGALSSSVSSPSDETTTATVEELQPITATISLWTQFDLSLVRWDVITELIWTWIGMVFVVSFASCLDVAAISMDLGEPLDTNQELTTVGLCNLMSGLAGGYTGSYIFSQTIFTFRTGVHSRWIGIFVMVFFAAVIASPMDILSVSPLFFFGATLIFIGFDLLYEWFYVIRHNVSLAEYGTIWGTFFAIQVVGIDFGIIVGIFFAIVEHVTTTAQTTDVHRVGKRSRAIWSPEEFQVLNDHAYNSVWPKIVTLEVSGPCFFGSSVGLLQKMIRELGLDTTTTTITTDQNDEPSRMVARSPHVSASMLASPVVGRQQPKGTLLPGTRRPPQFCVMDLTQVSNVDASAARGCFLALSRLASKHGITIVACGASPRIDWVLRSHDASYDTTEAEQAKERLHRRSRAALSIASSNDDPPLVKILMFLTSYEALEFCESLIVEEIHYPGEIRAMPTKFGPTIMEQTLSSIFTRLIGATPHEQDVLKTFDQGRYHADVYFNAGERIFIKDGKSEAFYVVLEGAVASGKARANVVYRNRQEIVTGGGFLRHQHRQGRSGSSSDLLDPELSDHVFPSTIATMFPVGAIFGYTDVFLGRPRSFEAFATKSCKVARIDQGHLQALRHEDPVLNGLLHRVLVKVCVLDLANCTCDDT